MTYNISVSDQVKEFLQILPDKSKRICKNSLQKLEKPFPGDGLGDKEKLSIAGEELYRLHIGRSYTAFYIIDSKKMIVRVIELLTIEKAHKKYKYK
jgi:mRNA-degrading endonuclease RelE of RelBE toxin-antitoxin system